MLPGCGRVQQKNGRSVLVLKKASTAILYAIFIIMQVYCVGKDEKGQTVCHLHFVNCVRSLRAVAFLKGYLPLHAA